jgi:DNA (cytosine-5)-methyltransferase 1
MRYLSLFSGIEAASAAFRPLGWTPVGFAEIEPFPCAVLNHHYPDVPNYGDVTKIDWTQFIGKIDLIIGGPPCTAFSLAGLRQSLNDPRGQLSLSYAKAITTINPLWAIAENVPGWLSTNDNAFGCYLAGITGADAPLLPTPKPKRFGAENDFWKWDRKTKQHIPIWPNFGMVSADGIQVAWRIVDTQYVRTPRFPRAIPQRRRRILAVRSIGNGAGAFEVLLNATSLSWHSPPSRTKGKTIAGKTIEGVESSSGAAIMMNTGQANAEIPQDISSTLNCNHEAPILAYDMQQVTEPRNIQNPTGENTGTLSKGNSHNIAVFENHPADSRINEYSPDESINTLTSKMGTGGGNIDLVLNDQGGDIMNVENGDTCPTIRRETHGHESIVFKEREGKEGGGKGILTTESGNCFTISTHQDQSILTDNPTAFRLDSVNSNAMKSTNPHSGFSEIEAANTLMTDIGHPDKPHGGQLVLNRQIRRLTVIEVERLFGFPDDFTKIPYRNKTADKCPDGPRYKALGNSISINCLEWIGNRIELVDKINKKD